MPVGAHLSISGGIHKAPERALELGCEAMQIFTRSNVRWYHPPLKDSEADAFKEAVERTGIQPVIAHACYLINIASADESIRKKSMDTMLDELRRCARLGIGGYVLHPGSHPTGTATAVERICEALDEILEIADELPVNVLLETTAGQGNQAGAAFEQLKTIIDGTCRRERLGVCFDTAHVFAAGYDIRTKASYARTLDHFDRIAGVGRIRAFHLNDSKRPLGSRVDRHEQIGHGQIGTEAFRLILHDERFKSLPMIIETPKKDDWDARNISLLKELRNEA